MGLPLEMRDTETENDGVFASDLADYWLITGGIDSLVLTERGADLVLAHPFLIDDVEEALPILNTPGIDGRRQGEISIGGTQITRRGQRGQFFAYGVKTMDCELEAIVPHITAVDRSGKTNKGLQIYPEVWAKLVIDLRNGIRDDLYQLGFDIGVPLVATETFGLCEDFGRRLPLIDPVFMERVEKISDVIDDYIRRGGDDVWGGVQVGLARNANPRQFRLVGNTTFILNPLQGKPGLVTL